MMPMINAWSMMFTAIMLLCCTALSAAEPIPPIKRRVPPDGIELPADTRAELEDRLTSLRTRYASVADHPAAVDVDVLLKAVDFALVHGEFYSRREIPRAASALQLASDRLDQLTEGKSPWAQKKGATVRGYYSSIDGSPQPYGLIAADDVDFDQPAPLYVWLHGRGDKVTDLHFIHRMLTGNQTISPPGAIVVHPFGRQCIGFKSAGEIDVLEAIADVQSRYKIDPDRVVLMGFSMGGAGAWHVGAHYADRFVAVSPGAGFAETARYTRLRREDYPPSYEQKLWGVYDVPGYVRNLFNLPVVVYSGEEDKQIQAARVMEEAYLGEGRKLPHVIGPGMGHKYHPDSLREIMETMDRAVQAGRDRTPQSVSLQTHTLRYNRMHWARIDRLEQHWVDSRLDAEITGEKQLKVTTKNVAALSLSPWDDMARAELTIDGQTLVAPSPRPKLKQLRLVKSGGKWQTAVNQKPDEIVKQHGLQGPIDDVFLAPFLVVKPTGECAHPEVQQWVDFELEHFQDRWRALFRGELRMKDDTDVTDEDIADYHLILWGDPASNRLIRRLLDVSEAGRRLPLDWADGEVSIGGASGDAARHVPLMIFPNPLIPQQNKYVVLNSGPTFREAHDRTNSLQNPKLPDWALIDISQPPDSEAPGRVVAADCFDERWGLKPASN